MTERVRAVAIVVPRPGETVVAIKRKDASLSRAILAHPTIAPGLATPIGNASANERGAESNETGCDAQATLSRTCDRHDGTCAGNEVPGRAEPRATAFPT